MKQEAEKSAALERSDSIVLIEPAHAGVFQRQLDRLNKKAVAFGLAPIRVVGTKDVVYQRRFEYVGSNRDKQLSYLVPVADGVAAAHPVILKRIEINYPAIKLGNWQVVGKLEAVDGGNLTFSVTRDADDQAALRQASGGPITCAHCATKRRRKDSFILREVTTGRYQQVGTNCLEDFTGHDPAVALFLAKMSELVRVAEGELEEYGRSGRTNAVDTRRYLADVSFITEHTGFVSAAKARDLQLSPTYLEALALPGELEENRSLRSKYNEEVERHLSTADAVRQWVAERTPASDFDRNVQLLLAAEALSRDSKHLAFAAAAVAMFNRERLAAAETRKPSVHVGAPGAKMSAELAIERVIEIVGPYGMSFLVLMKDTEGNRLLWKTSACPYDLRHNGVGRSIAARFKVAKHDDYKGVAQTKVTHLKVDRWLDEVPAEALEGATGS